MNVMGVCGLSGDDFLLITVFVVDRFYNPWHICVFTILDVAVQATL